MSHTGEEIVGQTPCACGCGENLILRQRHFYPSHLKEFPKFINGHQQFGNKKGWKRGWIKQGGYILVHSPNHPAANAMGLGYVRRARLVMEEYLGRYLEPDEVVHHINRIKDDDRIENLELMTNSEHLSLHHKGKPVNRDEFGRFTRKGVI